MKTISNEEIKAMNEAIRNIRDIMKSITEDDIAMDTAKSNYAYECAMSRNRERFFDLMRQVNEMAEQSAALYNHYSVGCDKWMIAKADYQVERL